MAGVRGSPAPAGVSVREVCNSHVALPPHGKPAALGGGTRARRRSRTEPHARFILFEHASLIVTRLPSSYTGVMPQAGSRAGRPAVSRIVLRTESPTATPMRLDAGVRERFAQAPGRSCGVVAVREVNFHESAVRIIARSAGGCSWGVGALRLWIPGAADAAPE
jgi:hypothetical protein